MRFTMPTLHSCLRRTVLTQGIGATFFLICLMAGLQAEALDRRVLDQCKAATVFVQAGEMSGSGFLFLIRAGKGYIVTNRHVVTTRDGKIIPNLRATFHSGSPESTTVPITNTVVDNSRDLAVLAFDLVPPIVQIRPLQSASATDASETVPVFMLGFPFGSVLAGNRGNPEVTVGRGSISSLRYDEDRNLAAIQIDGDINPGNSGGPVVTRRGTVVGIAVATVMGTQVSFAIPIQHLEEMLAGTVAQANLRLISSDERQATLGVSVQLVDPLENILRVEALFVEQERSSDPGIDQRTNLPSRLTGPLQRQQLVLDTDAGVATGEITLRSGRNGQIPYFFQLAVRLRNGQTRFTQAADYLVGFGTQPSGGVPPANDHTGASRPGSRQPSAPLPPEPDGPSGPAISFPDSDRESIRPTPAPIIDAVPASAGASLIVRYQGIPALAVYDLESRQVVRTIRIPTEEFLYTAGGDIVLVYVQQNNLISTFRVSTGERLRTRPNPFDAVVCTLHMGHSNDRMALIRSSVGTDALDRARMSLLDVQNLIAIETSITGGHRHRTSFRDNIHYASNGGMTLISAWATSHSPSGLGAFLRTGNNLAGAYEHKSVGYIAVGDDRRFYTGNGLILNSSLIQIGSLDQRSLIPGIGGSFVLSVDNAGNLTVLPSGSTAPIGPAGVFPMTQEQDHIRRNAWTRSHFNISRRILFNPRMGQLVMIPFANDTILQRDFNLKRLLNESGVDHLVVISAPPSTARLRSMFDYTIESLSSAGGVTHALEFGPDGMTVSAEGRVQWSVTGTPGQIHKVVILLRDSLGDMIYHNFELTITK